MKPLLFAIPLLFASTAGFAADTLVATIQKYNDAFERAFNTGDAAAVAQLYTPNAVILPPGAAPAKGRAAIQAYWDGAIKSGVKNASLTALSVEKNGQSAREIGRFSLDAPGPGGQMSQIEGKYVVVWKKIGSKWMLDTDIWNMNK